MTCVLALLFPKTIGHHLNYTSNPILSKFHLRFIPTLQNRRYGQKLPRQPVPALYDTLERFVWSCKPFLDKAEYQRTKALAVKFATPGDYGDKLQKYLEDRAKITQNWLADWWINITYLEHRNPLVLWSSVAQALPIQKPFKEEDGRLEYAAQVILLALDYKKIIEEGKLTIDKIDKTELDMQQYSRIFGTNRMPILLRDCMTFNPGSRHIVVAYKNNFYAVNVFGTDCSRSTPDVEQMKSLLKEIVDNTKRFATPIGLLTTHDRDSWANARQNLMEHPMNVESICLIEKALFLVCLDDGLDCDHDGMTRSAEQLMHGGGVCLNSANRWFDKSIQLVISMDGLSGVIVEPSSVEGRIVANLVDYIARNIKKDKKRIGTECFPTPKHLCFCYNNVAKQNIEVAAKHLDQLVSDIDIWAFKFENFGSNLIRAIHLSPDSFMQMAIQYAYYRMYCRPAATNYPGVTRMFLHGRTDVIRSCSQEALDFSRSMLREDETDLSRIIYLKEAVLYNKQYSKIVRNGGGVDRHLLGLRLAAQAMNMEVPPLFKDKGFTRSSYMRLHTAKILFKSDAFMCLGPLVLDGYGVCYNLHRNSINVAVTSFKSDKKTNSRRFHEELVLGMNDMKSLILRAENDLKLHAE